MSLVPLPSAVPPWALATGVLVPGLLVFSCCFCLYWKRCGRRMGKKSQAQAQVHLQEVKELGRSYINKVWPGPDPSPPPAPFPTLPPPAALPCPFPLMPTSFAHLLLGGSCPKPDPGELEVARTWSLVTRTCQFGGEVRPSQAHNAWWYVPHQRRPLASGVLAAWKVPEGFCAGIQGTPEFTERRGKDIPAPSTYAGAWDPGSQGCLGNKNNESL